MSIFPVGANKRPLTSHGFKDATRDETQIAAWWVRWPNADIGWAVPSDILVADLDCGKGADGLRDFQTKQGVSADDVETPQASTPSGGRHLIFSANGAAHRNGVRVNGHAVDLRTEGGYIVLPGAKDGRRWLKPLTTPLKPVPAWIAPKRHRTLPQVAPHAFGGATPYGRKALDRAYEAIRSAPNGAQEPTLNRECFSIGGLIAGDQLDHDPAVARLIEAAHAMPAHAEPWGDLSEKVRRSVVHGMRHPRRLPEGREGPIVRESAGAPRSPCALARPSGSSMKSNPPSSPRIAGSTSAGASLSQPDSTACPRGTEELSSSKSSRNKATTPFWKTSRPSPNL
jgi:hypothetical protein